MKKVEFKLHCNFNMWHEARKQEKKIRGIMVDYKKRAERRREYYEKIKLDPAQFLQVHGRPCKIHLDPTVAQAADSPATMMPWQGQTDTMIDRFDVRAHLDHITEYISPVESIRLSEGEMEEERLINYERYRTLVQNEFLGVTEDKFLHQIYLEERFGPIIKPGVEEEKKKLAEKKVAIGYTYEDSTPQASTFTRKDEEEEEEEKDDDDDDLSDIDLDVGINVEELTVEQCTEMNACSTKYGMKGNDYISFLHEDREEAEQIRQARELEEEKALYSGRKSRRKRRALREKELQGRRITSPPSYAARESPTYKPYAKSHSSSRSRSRSPINAGEITYITSFGGEGTDEDRGRASGLSKQKRSSTTRRHHHSGSKSGKHSDRNSRSQKKDSPARKIIGPDLPSGRSHRGRRSHNSRSPSRSSRHSSASSWSSRSSSRHHRRKHKVWRRDETRNRHRRTNRRRSRSRSSSYSSRSRSRSRNQRRRRRKSISTSRSRSHSRTRWRSRSKSSSRSRSNIKHKGQSNSKSRSKTPTRDSQEDQPVKLPSPPRKTYYRPSLSRSGSELSETSDTEISDKSSTKMSTIPGAKPVPTLGKAVPATKQSKLTPQEKLKRKMQALLNKQYKADKRAQQEKQEKQEQERQDRAEELREMAIRLRQKEREKRHRQREHDGDIDSEDSLSFPSRHDVDTRDDTEKPSYNRSPDNRDSSSPPSRSRGTTIQKQRTVDYPGGRSHRQSRRRSRSRSCGRSSSKNQQHKFSEVHNRKVNRDRSRSRSRSGSRPTTLRPLVDY
ncbi:CLK4-associating serine/arginine rich protein-like isoform X2 [Limulus polyphemus]|uniref:CLK4-associating serine/arginine rich protein-like isoform X2 n=1 Tax=Limulus polyphemus TaxID=6850 RepID=A0ABM1SF98_LIMPO|nr:CLK4-associating serine/arginine rich protein-like isoform X2 [Limulus polyphemus]